MDARVLVISLDKFRGKSRAIARTVQSGIAAIASCRPQILALSDPVASNVELLLIKRSSFSISFVIPCKHHRPGNVSRERGWTNAAPRNTRKILSSERANARQEDAFPRNWFREWKVKRSSARRREREREREKPAGRVKRSTWRERTCKRGTRRGRAVSKIIGTLSGSRRVRSETIIWGWRRGRGKARSKVTGKASGSEIGGK